MLYANDEPTGTELEIRRKSNDNVNSDPTLFTLVFLSTHGHAARPGNGSSTLCLNQVWMVNLSSVLEGPLFTVMDVMRTKAKLTVEHSARTVAALMTTGATIMLAENLRRSVTRVWSYGLEDNCVP